MCLCTNHHSTLPLSLSSFLLLWKQDLGRVWKFPWHILIIVPLSWTWFWNCGTRKLPSHLPNPCFKTLNLEWRICYSWLTWNSLDSKSNFLTFSPVCQSSSLWQNFNPFMSSFLSPGPDFIPCACGYSLVFDSLWSHGLYVAHHAPRSVNFSWQEYWSVEWVAISYSRESSWPRDPIRVSCIGRWILYRCATWEAWSYATATHRRRGEVSPHMQKHIAGDS